MGLTSVRFDAANSTGESLSYVIELGDGTIVNAPRETRSIMAAGSLTARLTVIDKYGRSDSFARQFTVVSLATISGWRNTSSGYYRSFQIRKHEGRVFGGVYYRWRPGDSDVGRPFIGTLRGDRGITATLDDGSVRFEGAVTDPLPGYCGTSPQLKLTIDGRDPDNGLTLPFEYYFGGC